MPTDLWDFAQRLYARPGVESACLHLQEVGADVCLLLTAGWLGGRGVKLMSNQPDIVAGLLIGTVAGVAVLRGVPVGPLIAAGILSLLVGIGQ